MSFKLRRKVSESGRTLVLRVPKDIERTLQLKAGDQVDIWVEKGIMMIKPLEKIN